MKLFWLLAGMAAGSPWGGLGGWTWDESGARYRTQEAPHPLFSSPGLLPPTLWNLPGPENSLIQYDGERGLLRFLLPHRAALLEIPATRCLPNTWSLVGGRLMAVENRRSLVLFPPSGQESAPADLPIPASVLTASADGDPLVKLLGGVWLRWDGETWQPAQDIRGSSSPGPEPVPPDGQTSSPEPAPPEISGDLESRGLWPEARLLATLEVSQPDAADLSRHLERLRKVEYVLTGQGDLKVSPLDRGLTAVFAPDSLGEKTWEWTLRFHPVKGEVLILQEAAGQELQTALPGELTWQDILWVDVEVSLPQDREKTTFFRLISREGLSYWLKNG